VQEALVAAKAGHFPTEDKLYYQIYADSDQKDQPQKYIRMPDYAKSIRN
jgi:hypothetical protein